MSVRQGAADLCTTMNSHQKAAYFLGKGFDWIVYTYLNKSSKLRIPIADSAKFLASFRRNDLLVELFCEDEVGGGAGDGDEAADGGCVRDAQRQTLADHVVPLGRIHGVPTDFGFLRHGNVNGNLPHTNR